MELPSFLPDNFSRLVDSFRRMRKVAFASCNSERGSKGICVSYRFFSCDKVLYLKLNFQLVYVVGTTVQVLQLDLQMSKKN